MRATVRLSLALIALGTVSYVSASSPAIIGMATAAGNFTVNQAQVVGNTTLFDGALVETGEASSQLQLNNGVQLELGANSRVKVSSSEAILEEGSGQIGSAAAYQIRARTLHIRTANPLSVARVRLEGDHNVLVAAVNGPVQVFNGAGTLVARMEAGLALAFDPTAAAPDAFDLTGCLLSKGGSLGLATDSQLYELQGRIDRGLVGSRVHVTGTTTNGTMTWPGAVLLVATSAVTLTDKGGCVALAAKYGVPLPETAGGTVAKPHHTTAIVAGVAVAGAGGGIAAWAATKGKNNNASR